MQTSTQDLRWQGKRTICAVLREIGAHAGRISQVAAEKGDLQSLSVVSDILGCVSDATVMAKKMDSKLREYRQRYDEEGFWEEPEKEKG